MPIYTRGGDKGQTSLKSGERVLKSAKRVAAYGVIDELNSFLGFVKSQIGNPNKKYKKYMLLIINAVQDDLFHIGSSIADKNSNSIGIDLLAQTTYFEQKIDEMVKTLPNLSHFILPGGGKAGSSLQVARTIARRAEREIVALSEKEKIDREILVYLNRLSDLLFTMARFANYKEKKKEIIWLPKGRVLNNKRKK